MYSLKRLTLAALALAVSAGAVALAADGPKLGKPITLPDLAPWDISIGPDGVGLPAGSGTVAQGEKIYLEKCQACHGEKGAGTPNDRLVGGQLLPATAAAVKTVGSFWPYPTTFFDYVRRAMPWNEPKSLTDAEVYAVAAYVFNLNGFIPADAVMNAQTLPKVEMPNKNGFINFPRSKF